MQPLQHARPGSSSADSSGQAEGIHAHPNGVDLGPPLWEMVIPGWREPVGILSRFHVGEVLETTVADQSVPYQIYCIEEICLGHTATLMLLQGTPLSQLFAGLLRQLHEGGTPSVIPGPWVLLAGHRTAAWEPPRLLSVTLARLFSSPTPEVAAQLTARLAISVLNLP